MFTSEFIKDISEGKYEYWEFVIEDAKSQGIYLSDDDRIEMDEPDEERFKKFCRTAFPKIYQKDTVTYYDYGISDLRANASSETFFCELRTYHDHIWENPDVSGYFKTVSALYVYFFRLAYPYEAGCRIPTQCTSTLIKETLKLIRRRPKNQITDRQKRLQVEDLARFFDIAL